MVLPRTEKIFIFFIYRYRRRTQNSKGKGGSLGRIGNNPKEGSSQGSWGRSLPEAGAKM